GGRRLLPGEQLVELAVVDALGRLLPAVGLALEELVDELVVGRLQRGGRRRGLGRAELRRDLAITRSLFLALGRLPGVLVLGRRQRHGRRVLGQRPLRLALLFFGRVLLGGGLLGGGLLGGGLRDRLRARDLRQLGPLVIGPH